MTETHKQFIRRITTELNEELSKADKSHEPPSVRQVVFELGASIQEWLDQGKKWPRIVEAIGAKLGRPDLKIKTVQTYHSDWKSLHGMNQVGAPPSGVLVATDRRQSSSGIRDNRAAEPASPHRSGPALSSRTSERSRPRPGPRPLPHPNASDARLPSAPAPEAEPDASRHSFLLKPDPL